MYLRPPRESGAAPDAAVAPSSARPTRFDPFLAPAALAGRSSPSSEESAETELSELARAHDWFEEANGRGRHEVSRRGPRGTEGVRNPWAEYANAALNFDALVSAERTERAGSTVSKLDEIPQRVLDVGCGVAAEWILTTAQLAGWERTQFVGLDLAPVLVSRSMFPPGISSRVSFVQHDAMKPLPFLDGLFDLIRCAGMTVGIPEPAWDPLVEELGRCLAAGGTLELLDITDRPTPPPRLRGALDSVMQHRLLNLDVKTVIPATLAMNEMKSITSVRLPGGSSTPLSSGEGREDAAIRRRALLAAWASQTKIQAETLAEAVTEAAGASTTSDATATAASAPAPISADREVSIAIDDWASDLLHQSGIAALMREHWGWTCTFDQETEKALARRLPLVEQAARDAAEALARATRDPTSDSMRKGMGIERLRAEQHEAATVVRDVRAQLEAVRGRLEPAGAETDLAGLFEGQAWICKK